MRRSTSLGFGLFVSLILTATAVPLAGCQLLAGLGGEEPLGEGGTAGTGTGASGGTGGSTGGDGGTGLTGACLPESKDPCYSGPKGTKGVGLCVAGEATCGADATWGACEGEVLPALETCAVTDDEDCNGYDCAVWVKSLAGNLYGEAIGVDGKGNVYAAISYNEGIDLGDGTPVVPVGNSDIALVKFDKAGTLLWKQVYPASGDQSVRAMFVDKEGNIALGGDTSGSIDFGTGSVAAGAFIAKLDADGKASWARGATSTTNATIGYTAIDSKGTVYVGGNGGSINFGAGLLESGDKSSFFVAKFDGGSGKPVWSKITKGGGQETLKGMSVDPSDSLVLSGTWDVQYLGLASAAQMPPNDLYNCCGLDAPFLLRLDASGAMSDGKMLAGYQATLGASVSDIAIDTFGVSTLVGTLSGLADFSSGKYDSGMTSTLFIVHDQTSGFNQWSKAFVNMDASAYGNAVAVDGHDNMVIQGTFGGPMDFGGGPLSDGGAFLVKLDKTGKFIWNRTFKFGDGGFTDLAAGSLEDETVAIGTFYQHADLGTGPIDVQQGVFIAKFGR